MLTDMVATNNLVAAPRMHRRNVSVTMWRARSSLAAPRANPVRILPFSIPKFQANPRIAGSGDLAGSQRSQGESG